MSRVILTHIWIFLMKWVATESRETDGRGCWNCHFTFSWCSYAICSQQCVNHHFIYGNKKSCAVIWESVAAECRKTISSIQIPGMNHHPHSHQNSRFCVQKEHQAYHRPIGTGKFPSLARQKGVEWKAGGNGSGRIACSSKEAYKYDPIAALLRSSSIVGSHSIRVPPR